MFLKDILHGSIYSCLTLIFALQLCAITSDMHACATVNITPIEQSKTRKIVAQKTFVHWVRFQQYHTRKIIDKFAYI
jgi:hypothetical protein